MTFSKCKPPRYKFITRQFLQGIIQATMVESLLPQFWTIFLHKEQRTNWTNKMFSHTVFSQRNFISTYREVTHTHGVLEKPLEAGGPAGHPLICGSPMAAGPWKTAIAGQAAMTAASLQLDSTVVCKKQNITGKRKLKNVIYLKPLSVIDYTQSRK